MAGYKININRTQAFIYIYINNGHLEDLMKETNIVCNSNYKYRIFGN